jgi:hypothetical protein
LGRADPGGAERLELAVAAVNQTYANARHDDSLETVAAEFLAARQDTVDLLRQFTDEQLAAAAPMVTGERAVGDLFAGKAGHATEHITWIEVGLRQSV